MSAAPAPGAVGSALATRLYAYRYWIFCGCALVIVALLGEALQGLLRELSYAAILDAVKAMQPAQLVLAALATASSFLALTGYDSSALRYVGVRLPYRVIAPTSFIAFALGNIAGIGVLTGGAVRMRMFGAAGVEAGTVARVIVFNALAYGLGLTTVGAAALLWGAPQVALTANLPAPVLRLVAGALLLGALAFFLRCFKRRALRFRQHVVLLPSPGLALQQLLWSLLDIGAAAAVLWVLLPAGSLPYPTFVAFYAIATVLGIISHVPGGLGVFEAVLLVALAGRVPTETLAGALVLYRLIYFVMPLALALGLLLVVELRRVTLGPLPRAAERLAPVLLAAFALNVGVVLLVAGITPYATAGTDGHWLPLPLFEVVHFVGSLSGLGLVIVARGMLQRLAAAWRAGMVLSALAFVLCMPVGSALTETVLLAFLLLALFVSRQQFTRPTALLAEPYSFGWLVSMAAIVAGLAAIMLFAHRDITWHHELWWQFAYDAHAPRALRLLTAVLVVTIALALRSVLRPRGEPLQPPDADTLTTVAAIVAAQDAADACLALNGDRYILLSTNRRAFVMFGRERRSWVALHDPVGPPEEWAELTWRFIERARLAGGRAAFYQVRPQSLTVYLDAGLQIFQLGEHATVPLVDFSLAGRRHATLRQAVRRAEREGLTFELLVGAQLPAALAELNAVALAWQDDRRRAGNVFCAGASIDARVRHQAIGVLRQHGRIVAFATLMTTANGVEAGIDLLRHLPQAPAGVIDCLFARLMLHSQAEGCQRFSLGMAPLSGMAAHPLAANWHRMSRLLFAHGEHFDGFHSLRAFKECFDPQWEARYLATPGGISPFLVLADVAALAGGSAANAASR